jgi:sterol desaturase/sphingolipid hydroxylase (fatty acid hydroxylase superfamily)
LDLLSDLSPGVTYFFGQVSKLFLRVGSQFSLTSLFCALLLAAGFTAYRRLRKSRPVRLKTIVRGLFPEHILKSRSNRADFGYLYFNVFINSLAFGWAVLSYQFLSNGIISALVALFGPTHPSALPEFASRSIITLMLFLAYEFGYWLNHYLSHRIPFMWEFHRVHHSAEVLTPITSARVHPVYTAIFANILAISAAVANGIANYLFGDMSYQYALSDTNIILVVFIHTSVHLQHTHVWISFRGLLGRVFMSPAHHQIHHSVDPKHFNKNLGSCLAVWDWMFGTLHVPAKEPEKLSFGVGPDHAHPHTFRGEFIVPFVRAFGVMRGAFRRPEAPAVAVSTHQEQPAQTFATPKAAA